MTRALIFPGQGAQYVGMAMDLAAASPAAAARLSEAEQVLGLPLGNILRDGPEAELTRTDISQPAILVASVMAQIVLTEHLAKDGRTLEFTAAAGLSLGEYTALVAAGAISFVDAVRLVRLRGEAMQAAAEAVPSGMVALIGADEGSAQKLCDLVANGEVLQVANLNATGQVVISGTAAACARAVEAAKDVGIRRAMALPVAGAFHSALMMPAAAKLHTAIAGVTLHDPRKPVYTNVHAGPIQGASEIPDLLVRQLTQPVRWADSVIRMQQDGITEFWELGPGKTLSGMISRTIKDVTCKNLDKAADAAAF